jgi:hypothetical protein
MLAKLHRRHGGRKVRVVRRAHHHGIDLFAHLVEHLAKIAEAPRLGMGVETIGGILVIDVAQGHDVLLRKRLDIECAATADPDEGEVELVVGRCPGLAD